MLVILNTAFRNLNAIICIPVIQFTSKKIYANLFYNLHFCSMHFYDFMQYTNKRRKRTLYVEQGH